MMCELQVVVQGRGETQELAPVLPTPVVKDLTAPACKPCTHAVRPPGQWQCCACSSAVQQAVRSISRRQQGLAAHQGAAVLRAGPPQGPLACSCSYAGSTRTGVQERSRLLRWRRSASMATAASVTCDPHRLRCCRLVRCCARLAQQASVVGWPPRSRLLSLVRAVRRWLTCAPMLVSARSMVQGSSMSARCVLIS
jgi:hypothetical protein